MQAGTRLTTGWVASAEDPADHKGGAPLVFWTLMPRVPLIPCHLLDPRSPADAAARPIVDAVNIALAELPQRTHELPARDEVIPVVGPSFLAAQTVAWLTSNGRRALVQPDFDYVATRDVASIGRLWRPTAFLAEVLPELLRGRALDLACGTGRDAVYMASCGWHVTAVDVLPDALARARDLAARCAAAIEAIELQQADLEHDPPAFAASFDLITVFRFLHRPLFARFADWLRPGGHLVYETFTTLHRARHGRPAADAHVIQPGELLELLAGLELRHFSEEWRGTAHTVRAWAVRT